MVGLLKEKHTFRYCPQKEIRKGDKYTIQMMNENIVLSIFRQVRQISKAGLVERVHLSPATVGKIVDRLCEDKLVRYVGRGNSKGGRPPEMYQFNPDGGAVLGIQVEADLVRMMTCNLEGGTLATKALPNSPRLTQSPADFLAGIIEEACCGESAKGRKVRGVGIGFAGVTDPESGRVILAPGMEVWEGIPIRSYLADCFAFPMYFDNEVNMAALGELHFGGWDLKDSLFFVKIGRGIGGGLVVGDHIYHGANCAASEIGLLPFTWGSKLSPSFARLEDLAVGPLFERAIGKGKLCATKWDALTAKALDLPVDGESNTPVSNLARYLAYGLASVVCLLDPELIVVGGQGCVETDSFICMVRETLAGILHSVPRVEPSRLGHNAVILGAVAVVLQRFASQREFA